MCACDECIRKEGICSENEIQTDAECSEKFCFCPLCNSVIKAIYPYEGGKEVKRYWDWVYETKPSFSKNFMSEFKHSAAIIQKVYIDENASYSKDGKSYSDTESSSCSLS